MQGRFPKSSLGFETALELNSMLGDAGDAMKSGPLFLTYSTSEAGEKEDQIGLNRLLSLARL